MKLLRTALPGVVVIEPDLHRDERGWFMESYHAPKLRERFVALGLTPPPDFVQDNHSASHRGVMRGLHHQVAPHAQGKLVRVVRGAVYDVAVDIRPESPDFGRWVGVELDARNRLQMWIPEGFAHGMLSLEDDTEVLYKCTACHCAAAERTIAWNDPRLAIDWPLKRCGGALRMSPRDAAAPPLAR